MSGAGKAAAGLWALRIWTGLVFVFVFAPIFFATAGLRVDLGLLADSETIMWALIVLAIASLSKFLGSILGAQLSFLPLREGAALGARARCSADAAAVRRASHGPVVLDVARAATVEQRLAHVITIAVERDVGAVFV